MSDEKKYSLQEAHQAFAAGLFNQCWELLEKEDRSEEDTRKLINAAHASLYHWSRIGKPINLQRGEWMISHVYSVMHRSEPALYHARNCLKLTREHDFKDFDLAYAYEAMARASAANDDRDEFTKYFKMAEEAAEQIAKEGDNKQFLSDLEAEPWFGLKPI
ncbi:hypothetical protein JW877_01690 [bacterium]|nr:hypothetical protein [bacterium]